MTTTRPLPLLAGATVLLGILIWSGLNPYDRTTWALEVAPVVLAVAVMAFSYRRFPLTDLLYVCIFAHSLVLIVGGMYTYARVPFGFQLADLLHISRNPYDKIGHFFQGFVPALVAREILLRGKHVTGRRMLNFLVGCVVLAISAVYELIEWGAAEILGQGADEFLGTQGYAWDTQSDMLMALIGAVAALLLCSRLHDRQILAIAAITARRD
jgi:putative membrane protein